MHVLAWIVGFVVAECVAVVVAVVLAVAVAVRTDVVGCLLLCLLWTVLWRSIESLVWLFCDITVYSTASMNGRYHLAHTQPTHSSRSLV